MSSTARTCRGPTAASTSFRARRGCSRAIRIACTSKDAARKDEWQEATEVAEQFEHPLWKDLAERASGAGHGGMDYIEDYRLIKCLREGRLTDMNVYDAAALSAVVELSTRSNAHKSAPLDVPDFTRGKWKTNPPLDIVRM